MLKPNTPCVVYRSDGYDKFGMPNEAVARKTLCVIDKLDPYIEKTSVRADSSGSRGFAEEVLITSKLMFSGNEDIKLGDRVQVLDEDLRVNRVSKMPGRKQGCVAYKQVYCSIWQFE